MKALLYLASSQFLIAFNIISIKYALNFTSAQIYTSLRYFFAFLFSLGLCFITRQNFKKNKTAIKKYFPILALQAICGGILFNIFMTVGLEKSDASIAGIITSVLPIVTIIMSCLIFQAKMTQANLTAIFICVLGLLLVSGSKFQGHHHLMGDALIFLALIPESVYYILTQRYPSPISLALNACIAFALNSSLFLILVYPHVNQFNQIPFSIWILIVIQGLSLSMNYFLWLKGCEEASQTTVALSSAFMPLITLGLATLFFHEHLNILQVIGVSLILSTLIFHQKTSKEILN